MKRMKKILALVLSLALALTLALPAFATTLTDDGITLPTVTTGNTELPNLNGHSFAVYQIFKGTPDKVDGNDVLVGIDWAVSFKAEQFLDALKNSNAFGETNPFVDIAYDAAHTNRSADEVARIISEWPSQTDVTNNYGDSKAKAFADIAIDYVGTAAYTFTVDANFNGQQMDAGYYLVQDASTTLGEDQAYNLFILNMYTSGNYQPTVKANVPSMEKKVLEVNDSAVENTNAWQDHADYDIGDNVPFTLSGTLPSDYANYESYKYVFHDTLSAGLLFNQDSVKVYIDGQSVDVDTYIVETTGLQNDETFTVTFADLKTSHPNLTATSVIQVYYTAKLLDSAVIGGVGNDNKAHLEFTNNPNPVGAGTPPTGTTPEDKVTVFTFALVANKVQEDAEGNTTPLTGAGFTLSKKDAEGNYTPIGDELMNDENDNPLSTFTFKGLDAGEYKLEETTVPAGFNKAEVMYFKVEAVYNNTTTPPTLDKVVIKSVNDASGNQIVGADGTTPTFAFVLDGDNNGTLKGDILNLRGILLPSTGGIGTTIFYVVGGLLIIGAGVLLIAKKRMGGHAE